MTNNLLRYVGSAEFAKGTYIELFGRVLDNKCVPVSAALIEIWQLDNQGYDSNYYSTITNPGLVLNAQKADKNFVGSGSAITNNLGYYRFYTVIPGNNKKNRLPHINFLISHKDFIPLQTQLFFAKNDTELKKDMIIRKYTRNKIEREKIVAQKIGSQENIIPGIKFISYKFDIVLSGENKYKTY